MTTTPQTEFDGRFSDPSAAATPWSAARAALERAELYWLSTVRLDGRPHVTPLVGIWLDGGLQFCTGAKEQKARNLRSNSHVVVTTGANLWAQGLDVVVEGDAVQVFAADELQALADAYRAKYDGEWDFDVGDGLFNPETDRAHVFRVEPDKVIAFAKDPHAQTRYRFGPMG